VSDEASVVKRDTDAVLDSIEESMALFGAKAAALSALVKTVRECSEDDWDGCGALAISERAIRLAEDFIRALPDDIPLPEYAPEPDGAISIDWIRSRNRLFSVTIGSSNRLPYAWLDGTDTGHAVATFNGEAVPRRILDGVRSVLRSD
jgi:hypothetical protein